MKNYLKMAAIVAAVCVTASCEHIELAQENPNGGENFTDEYVKKFAFTVKGDFQNPTFSDGQTRANAYMTADEVEMTDLWVIDYKDGEVKQQLHQVNTDPDWGAPTVSLTLGTHHILFLASRGQNPTYADGVVTWTKPLDAFYLDYEVLVVKTSNGNRAVTLNRCATKATIYIEDAIPSGTTSMTLTPSTWFTGWNMLTGEPVAAPSGYDVTFAVPEQYAGVSGVNYSIWSLSGADEWTSDITIESKAGDTVNASAVIEGAPFKANRATIYRGNLYSNSEGSSVSLSTEWLTQYEGVY